MVRISFLLLYSMVTSTFRSLKLRKLTAIELAVARLTAVFPDYEAYDNLRSGLFLYPMTDIMIGFTVFTGFCFCTGPSFIGYFLIDIKCLIAISQTAFLRNDILVQEPVQQPECFGIPEVSIFIIWIFTIGRVHAVIQNAFKTYKINFIF